jgi:hypothetical protein
MIGAVATHDHEACEPLNPKSAAHASREASPAAYTRTLLSVAVAAVALVAGGFTSSHLRST